MRPALAAMLVEHLAARGLAAGDADALLFTAPGGGVLRYSNWLRRRWYPAAVAAGVGRMVTDDETGQTSYRVSASMTCAGPPPRGWSRRASR